MTGCAFLAVPGFLGVPKGVQEATGATSIVLRRLQAEEWSQIRTIVSDSYVPDQERSDQEGRNAKVCAGLRFLIPGVSENSSGSIICNDINALAAVPGFLPSLKRGDGLGTVPLQR
jgi:hypothetical protein